MLAYLIAVGRNSLSRQSKDRGGDRAINKALAVNVCIIKSISSFLLLIFRILNMYGISKINVSSSPSEIRFAFLMIHKYDK